MGKIRWSTLICDPKDDTKISLHRLAKFSSIVLGLLGGLVIIGAMVVGMFTEVNVKALFTGGGILVAPMTGGHISDAIHGKFTSDRIMAGKATGRRAADRGGDTDAGHDTQSG